MGLQHLANLKSMPFKLWSIISTSSLFPLTSSVCCGSKCNGVTASLGRNLHFQRMAQLLMKQPGFLVLESVDPQFTGGFPLGAPCRYAPFGIPETETPGPFAAGTELLSGVHDGTLLFDRSRGSVEQMVGAAEAGWFMQFQLHCKSSHSFPFE